MQGDIFHFKNQLGKDIKAKQVWQLFEYRGYSKRMMVEQNFLQRAEIPFNDRILVGRSTFSVPALLSRMLN